MRVAMEVFTSRNDWKSAAAGASNLSQLELTLGAVAMAVEDAEQAVTYADRSGDAFQRMGKRTTLADALHWAGRRAEAEALFREVEAMQAECQPAYPLLYSLPGFRYCDLLLAEAEQGAWEAMQNSEFRIQNSAPEKTCRVVSERAAQTLKWAIAAKGSLLSIALDHLTLGRASQLDDLPGGLLTRAWQRSLTGAHTSPESAQSDLNEAWEISERGPMPLFLADIHLHRARLFHAVKPYPWESPHEDLAQARRLIEKHGYWRRKGELEDAEAAASNY